MVLVAECVDEQALVDFTHGRLSEDARSRVEIHLDACDACRELVGALAATDTERTLDPGDAGPSAGDEAELQRELVRGNPVGRYILLDVLGMGGMGVVYSAYDPELDRKVALKLLHAEAASTRASEASRSRLVREAQALARLAHPNVLAVYDVGTHGDRVFIAMELVEGGSLRGWLGAEKRTWRDVLGIFVAAGRGLAAAHAAGLVHRDFKTDNVLVGMDNRARITDFGLVRMDGSRRSVAETPEARDAPIEAGLSLTRTGALLGTPGYMAPEQLSGQTADARTDQFSYCVAFYEALYGERPFEGRTVVELAAELKAGNVRPPPPATNVPRWLRRLLLRGLSTSREMRFPSMQHLLDALARDPASTRRRWLLGAGAVAVLGAALLGGRALRPPPMELCRGASQRLVGVWDAKTEDAVQKAFARTGKPFADDAAREIRRVLSTYSESWVRTQTETCKATRVSGDQSEETLSSRMECLDRRLGDLAALSRTFANADAQTVEKAVQAARSLGSLEACATAQGASGFVRPHDPEMARRVDRLRGRIAEAEALLLTGKAKASLDIVDPVTNEARALDYRPIEAESLYALGRARSASGDPKAARDAFFQCIHIAEASRQDSLVARAWVGLLWVLASQLRDPAESHRWIDFARAAIARADHDDETEAKMETTVAALMAADGDFTASERHDRAALAIRERIHGEVDPTVAASLNNLADTLDAQGRHLEARDLFARALSIHKRLQGPSHPLVGSTLNNMCISFAEDWRPAEAVPLCEEALAIREAALGSNHRDVGSTLDVLGNATRLAGDFEKAAEFHRRAVAVISASPGSDAAQLAPYLHNYGQSLIDLGRFAEATAALDRASTAVETARGPNHPLMATMHLTKAQLLIAEGQLEAARREVRAAHGVVQKALGDDHPDMAEALHVEGTIERRQGRYRAALGLEQKALAIRERHRVESHPALVPVLLGVGQAHLGLHAPEKALPLFERALHLCEEAHLRNVDVCRAEFLLAQALWELGGDRGRARRLAEQATADLAKAGGPFVRESDDIRKWIERRFPSR